MKNRKTIMALSVTIIVLLAIIGILVYFIDVNNKSDNNIVANNVYNTVAQNSISSNVTTNSVAITNDVSISETNTNVQPRELNNKELIAFEQYFNDLKNNGFLISIYEKPEEVNLNEVLYSNAIETQMTQEEIQDYLKHTDMEEMYTDCGKYTKSDINRLLNEKMGISLEDITTKFSYVYMEKYDAYYNMRGDTNYMAVKCIAGKIDENGMYVIDYEMGESERTVTMRKKGDNYLFVSNV